jgi:hypothetical protein
VSPEDFDLDEVERLVIITGGEFDPAVEAPGEVIAFASQMKWDEEFFEWWLPQQRIWQSRAAEVLKFLETHDPMPDADEVIGGNPVIPEWTVQWWAYVLRFPYAARLGEAVEAAEAWRDSNPVVYR